MSKRWSLAIAAVLAVAVVSGCATKKYARVQVSDSEQRVGGRLESVESMVEESQELIDEQGRRLDEQDARLGELSKTTREALERATAAGKLAEGKLVYERVLSDSEVRFGLDRADLSDTAKAALDRFARELAAQNEGVYVEIQGHTDSTGSESHNLELGYRRAEAVRLYLNREHGLPLHRTSVISYGESEPIADNGTRDGRQRNRRVSLVVLR